MTTSLDRARHESERMLTKARQSIARRSESRGGNQSFGSYRHGSEPVDTPFGPSTTTQDNFGNAQRQYQSFRGTAATAIRPIAMRAMQLPFRCGFAGVGSGAKGESAGLIDLWLEGKGYCQWECEANYRETVKAAPTFLRKDLNNSKIKPLEDHFLLKLLANPNEMYRGSALKYLSYASMMLTGRFVWWFDTDGEPREDVPELGNLRLWYLPRHWLFSTLEESRWEIRSPGMSGSVPVHSGQLFMSTIPDPENPYRPYSPLQSQAASVDAEDKMLKAQAVTLDNVIRPSVILVAGRLPGMPGSGAGRGPRPILNADQRQQLVDAIKITHSSWRKYGEPAIVDGLIEDIKPFMASPSELDFNNSVTNVSRRVMEGMGTSPVIAGFTENANRAGSQIAKEVFNENTMAPLVTFVSEDMDATLGPRFSIGSRRLHVWQDQPQANDPDMLLQRVAQGWDSLSTEEKREFMRTGELNYTAILSDEQKRVVSQVVSEPGLMRAVTGGERG